MSRVRRREDGSMSVELVLMMPLVLTFLFFIADIGRLAEARGQVQAAASDAARAASVQRSAADGDAAANAAVVSDLGGLCPGKDHPAVPSGPNPYTPGSLVTYTVTCPVSVIPLFGTTFLEKTMTETATAPLETFRRSGP